MASTSPIQSSGSKTVSAIPTGQETVFVDRYVDGILDPGKPMLGPVKDGGYIVSQTAPGCWGPMITPAIRGGHEVTQPVFVEGAEVGDAIVVRIQEIAVTSLATASGTGEAIEGRFLGDPFVAGRCPQCQTLYPATSACGIGQSAIRCSQCGADASPFRMTNGYTIAFNADRTVGVTLPAEAAEAIGRDAKRFSALPEQSKQNSILVFAPHHLVGVIARLRPFLGQLGTTPSIPLPDSHNAGDFGQFLIGAPHEFGITESQLQHRTDGHLDIDSVRQGAVLICPVKVPGGGIYMGDMHALQGDGEIAGHTCDVAGTVKLQVHVLKNWPIDGPVLLPVREDLPYLAQPFSSDERARALALSRSFGLETLEESLPISVIGTGADLNKATDNGLERTAKLLDMPLAEVKNRATTTGAIEIGRLPGVVQVTCLVPVNRLEKCGLLPFVKEQYVGQ